MFTNLKKMDLLIALIKYLTKNKIKLARDIQFFIGISKKKKKIKMNF